MGYFEMKKQMDRKLSIITVCLNSEATIEQTIESVLVQKDENVEYIIVDGNSTDRTLDIVDKYRKDIEIIISEPDCGIYDAMNKGISLAKGEIIGIINSDDWYEPGAFKSIRKTFLNSGADIVYGKMNLVSENGNFEQLVPMDIEKLRYEMEIPHPTAFVKKNIYEKFGLFSMQYKIAADYDLMLRYYTNGVKFAYRNEILANFRWGGVSNQQSKVCAYETIAISKKYLPYCPSDKRADLEKTIDNKWKPFFFRQLLCEAPDWFFDGIKNKLHRYSKSRIAIFGAGTWGMDMFKRLSEGGFSPSLFVDNNKNLWEKSKETIRISSPDSLRTFDGILLILAKGFSEEILLQVKGLDNPMLICITWEELADEFKDHVFPG